MRGVTFPYSLPYAALAGRGVWSIFYRLLMVREGRGGLRLVRGGLRLVRTGGRCLCVFLDVYALCLCIHCIHDVLVNAVGACRFSVISVHVFSEDIPKKGAGFREALPG